MRLKKLDSLLIKSFLPPFVLATFIALFVLIMQTLWLYIDDILGKGANLFIVMEFLFYLSMSLVPMALPVGILLASVMLFGNLGEQYELSSMKSAGISLFRIMKPLVFLCAGISIFSFLCNEYIIPFSNLKFKSRLYDLRKSKPTLKLEEGVFNEDFQGYVIHIGKKGEDGRHLQDVLIYDHKNTESKGQTNIIRSESGEMYSSEDNNFFIMKLHDGYMYQEMDERRGAVRKSYPFLRSSFKEWTKIFDLREFEMNRTDEDLFKSNQSMKNTSQLGRDIDSLKLKMTDLKDRSVSDFENVDKKLVHLVSAAKTRPDSSNTTRKQQALVNKARKQDRSPRASTVIARNDSIAATAVKYYFEAFNSKQQNGLLTKVKNEVEVIQQRIKNNHSAYERVKSKHIKHVYLLHSKYSFAFVCIIFLFIGAPMGAIVRKGGFGYPLLISIVFFILFILMNIFFKKLAETNSMDATLAAWLPVLVLAPIGTLLTYKAMNDSKILDISRINDFFRRMLKKGNEESSL